MPSIRKKKNIQKDKFKQEKEEFERKKKELKELEEKVKTEEGLSSLEKVEYGDLYKDVEGKKELQRVRDDAKKREKQVQKLKDKLKTKKGRIDMEARSKVEQKALRGDERVRQGIKKRERKYLENKGKEIKTQDNRLAQEVGRAMEKVAEGANPERVKQNLSERGKKGLEVEMKTAKHTAREKGIGPEALSREHERIVKDGKKREQQAKKAERKMETDKRGKSILNQKAHRETDKKIKQNQKKRAADSMGKSLVTTGQRKVGETMQELASSRGEMSQSKLREIADKKNLGRKEVNEVRKKMKEIEKRVKS